MYTDLLTFETDDGRRTEQNVVMVISGLRHCDELVLKVTRSA